MAAIGWRWEFKMNGEKEYLSVFQRDTGKRLTSYVTGVHGDTYDELEAFAANNFPDDFHVKQTYAEWLNTVDSDLYWNGKQLTNKPAKTDEERKQEELDALDKEYEALISAKKEEIIEAVVVYQDADLAASLREELNALYSEYESKREEIENE